MYLYLIPDNGIRNLNNKVKLSMPKEKKTLQSFDWHDYSLKFLLISGLIAYAFNYLIAQNKNSKIAIGWGVACQNSMIEAFTFSAVKLNLI